ncbi:MAG: geranylgeranylglycerol-phosphate geranylgeranyltransferase [Chitinivibrionia bacterium]|nr:geranylgeranylglycerol-phosphate geranylgeranyltransferase [Chitinivibrionia bacterium]
MKNLVYFFQIIRVGNALIASAGIALGWIFCNDTLPISDLIFRIFAGFFALGYGNIINDICDVKTDKISHPNRLLASGKITLKFAIIFAIICFILSAFAGFCASYKLGAATLIALFVLTLYSVSLKATPFAGNFVVALLTGYALIFGGLGENVTKILYPAILAFLANFAREIVKDLSDEEGDKSAGLKTTSSVSLKYIKAVIYLQFIVFIVVAPVPFFLDLLGKTYILITVSFVTPLHFMYIKYFRENDYKNASKSLKIQMIIGLLAVAADYFLKL